MIIARTTDQIGAALRRHRKLAGLTQSQLGAKAGLRQATISQLENGEGGIGIRTLVDVLAALELELIVQARSTSSTRIEDLF